MLLNYLEEATNVVPLKENYGLFLRAIFTDLTICQTGVLTQITKWYDKSVAGQCLVREQQIADKRTIGVKCCYIVPVSFSVNCKVSYSSMFYKKRFYIKKSFLVPMQSANTKDFLLICFLQFNYCNALCPFLPKLRLHLPVRDFAVWVVAVTVLKLLQPWQNVFNCSILAVCVASHSSIFASVHSTLLIVGQFMWSQISEM